MLQKVKPKVFLSYCDEDRALANDLITFMRGLNINLTFDDKILLASDRISDKLREEIERAHGCVWFLTEKSISSRWCPVEVGAFWGAGKPIIIYNPSGLKYDGPLHDIKQARSLDDIQRTLEGLEVRSKPLATVTLEEASQMFEEKLDTVAQNVVAQFAEVREFLPALKHLDRYLETQNNYLPSHAEVLARTTRMVERSPRKLRIAMDVPSFGSISAEREYRICCDTFDTYIAKEEWDISILLLPVDVGINIVNTEFSELNQRRRAWSEDIQALHRFQGYQQRAVQRGHRKFNISWMGVNRDVKGVPLGLHSMPLNIWIADDEEAVFSTVIDNYHPTRPTPTSKSQVQEIGFSTRNPDMVRFLIEIMEKYAQNTDENITVHGQIAASEEVKQRIEGSM